MLRRETYLRSIRRPNSGRVAYAVLNQQLSEPLQSLTRD